MQNLAVTQQSADEQRDYARVRMELAGKVFIPSKSSTIDCVIVDLSAGGAGLRYRETPPPPDWVVVLYIDGFGRFEGVTTRASGDIRGLRFVCGEAKRQRLVKKLTAFVNSGCTAVTQLRRHERTPLNSQLYFIRPCGEQRRCDVLDISLQGISLRTNMRPPIGEILNLGRTYGRVIRHHEEGIGIEFVNGAGADTPIS